MADDEAASTRNKFLTGLRSRWLRSAAPRSVICDDNLEDAVVQTNSNLNVRFTWNTTDSYVWSWSFEVTTKDDKYLRNVSLALDSHRKNYGILSVVGDNFCFHSPEADGQHVEALPLIEDPLDSSNSSTHSYMVEIKFHAKSVGTYCQDVIFGFGDDCPVIRRQLVNDCVVDSDNVRLQAAKEYLMYLSNNVAIPSKSIVPFNSPFVTDRDPRELELCDFYPKPDVDTFFLTHSTLKAIALDPQNYRRILHELVTIEEIARREQIARYNQVTELRLYNCFVLASDTDGSTVAKYAAPGELFAQFPLGREVSEDSKSGRLLLRSCTHLLVQKIEVNKNDPNGPPPVLGPKIFEAHVEDKCNHSIFARLSKDCVEYFNLKHDTSEQMFVQFVMNRTPFAEWHRAIDALPDPELIFPKRQLGLSGTSGNGILQQQLKNLKFEWSPEWALNIKECQLNERQKEAVAAMMAPSNLILPPILILGPFGTGKTSTIAQALRILLVNDLQSKVILCTHSNSAADLYVKEFFDLWYKETEDQRLKPLRIYYKGRTLNTVHLAVRPYCPIDSNGRFRDPTPDELENCGLVISTLATSSCLTGLDYTPTHIIIDEAAQALECEALACLSMATPKTRLILAGDQMQLAPEVYSDLARERGLGISLLERIHLIYEKPHPCRVQLCKNYRAHADIVKLTSELFYGGQIEHGATLPRHERYAPLTFYACEGVVQKGSNSTGFYNDIEAAEIAERVSELRRKWPTDIWGPFQEGSIGVVSHYAEQVARIRSELRKRKLFNVSVERVLNVQGKQFVAVFISIVRTRHCSRLPAERNLSDYGFLTNPRLLNTAVTRAKSLVAVVGDPVGLLTIGSCVKHWRLYLRSASVHGMEQRELEFHLNKVLEEPAAPALNPLAEEFVPRESVRMENPTWIEYVPMPVPVPIIHCAVDPKGTVVVGKT
ncbi:hypothetical protein TKK_0006992 [Trichogramma kaykai]